jgi:hypothetical protein
VVSQAALVATLAALVVVLLTAFVFASENSSESVLEGSALFVGGAFALGFATEEVGGAAALPIITIFVSKISADVKIRHLSSDAVNDDGRSAYLRIFGKFSGHFFEKKISAKIFGSRFLVSVKFQVKFV